MFILHGFVDIYYKVTKALIFNINDESVILFIFNCFVEKMVEFMQIESYIMNRKIKPATILMTECSYYCMSSFE